MEIFRHLNTSMQGQDENTQTSTDRLVALQWKIVILKVKHLATLEHNIQHYFPSLVAEQYDWVRYPFAPVTTDSSVSSHSEEEELASLSADCIL
jgi:hypothetical protein